MTRSGALLLAALAIASLVLVTRREAGPPVPAAASGSVLPPQPIRVEPTIDPGTIRDLFHFVERPPVRVPRVERTPAPAVTDAADSPEPFRLVGLVRREGRLLAAFAVDGDVVLLGPGETTGDVSVLEVGEEGVRIRRRDGTEERLALP